MHKENDYNNLNVSVNPLKKVSLYHKNQNATFPKKLKEKKNANEILACK